MGRCLENSVTGTLSVDISARVYSGGPCSCIPQSSPAVASRSEWWGPDARDVSYCIVLSRTERLRLAPLLLTSGLYNPTIQQTTSSQAFKPSQPGHIAQVLRLLRSRVGCHSLCRPIPDLACSLCDPYSSTRARHELDRVGTRLTCRAPAAALVLQAMGLIYVHVMVAKE